MQTIDTQTGEVIETTLTVIPEAIPDIFTDIAAKPVTDEQAAILLAETDPDDLDILPTGEVYLSQARYRQRLNQAFKPGAWAMRPLSKPYIKDNLAMQEWALYANGQFIAYAVGGAEYSESNQRMNWSDVLETVKSNALMRLCKDLGIASECWNKRFTEAFKAGHCVKVFVEGRPKPQWRRLDSDPFYKETGATNDSPNRDRYEVPGRGKTGTPGKVEREQPKAPAPSTSPANAPVSTSEKPYRFPSTAASKFFEKVQSVTSNHYKDGADLEQTLGGWFNFGNAELWNERLSYACDMARQPA